MVGAHSLFPLAAVVRTDGPWLIGIGALLLAAVGLAVRPLRLHLQFGGLAEKRTDRIAFTATTNSTSSAARAQTQRRSTTTRNPLICTSE